MRDELKVLVGEIKSLAFFVASHPSFFVAKMTSFCLWFLHLRTLVCLEEVVVEREGVCNSSYQSWHA